MAPQLTIDGRELELETPPAPCPVAPAEGLFRLEAFAQLSGQRALELEELEPRSVPCPRCSAGVGSPCELEPHPVHGAGVHAPRVRDAQRAAQGLVAPDTVPACASEPESARERTPDTDTSSEIAAEERAALEQLRRLERMRRGAAKARERQWRARLREILSETRARYPRCRCELRAGMSREELQHLAGGCTDPNYVCPRLAAVRRLLARRESE